MANKLLEALSGVAQDTDLNLEPSGYGSDIQAFLQGAISGAGTGLKQYGQRQKVQRIVKILQDAGIDMTGMEGLEPDEITKIAELRMKIEESVREKREAIENERISKQMFPEGIGTVPGQGGGWAGETYKRGDFTYKRQPTEAEIQQGIDIKTREKAATEAVTPYTEAESKTLEGAREIIKEITDLENIIKNEPTDTWSNIPYFGSSAQAGGVKIPFVAPYGISEKGQEYRTLRESINNRLLYLRSGAQINDKEYQRLSGMLPMIFRSDYVDLQQLKRFKNEFANLLQRIQSGKKVTEQEISGGQPQNGQGSMKSKYGLE